MSSTLEIANIALALLGERPLIGLDDDSDVARQVNVVLEPVIDAILDSYEWNCATYRADLNLESDAPVFEKVLGILSGAAKGQRNRVLDALGKVFA